MKPSVLAGSALLAVGTQCAIFKSRVTNLLPSTVQFMNLPSHDQILKLQIVLKGRMSMIKIHRPQIISNSYGEEEWKGPRDYTVAHV
jgi:hypothetical protein